MKFSMKLLNMLYLPSKDEQQKSPESVGFVPHSHFFKNIINEVFNEVSLKCVVFCYKLQNNEKQNAP